MIGICIWSLFVWIISYFRFNWRKKIISIVKSCFISASFFAAEIDNMYRSYITFIRRAKTWYFQCISLPYSASFHWVWQLQQAIDVDEMTTYLHFIRENTTASHDSRYRISSKKFDSTEWALTFFENFFTSLSSWFMNLPFFIINLLVN